jgi:hypothetical protein
MSTYTLQVINRRDMTTLMIEQVNNIQEVEKRFNIKLTQEPNDDTHWSNIQRDIKYFVDLNQQ